MVNANKEFGVEIYQNNGISLAVVAARSKVTFSCVLGPRFESRRRQNLFLRIFLSTL
jgi:hypothetical protein